MKQILNFINGEFVATAKQFEKRTPVDNSIIGMVHEAGKAEVDAAVSAARAALDGPWGRMTVNERTDLLNKVADEITRRFDEFLAAECADTGKPKSLASHIDIPRGAKVSGARFYFLTGQGAMLELALINLAMAKAMEWGFTPILPPALVKPSSMEGTGYLGQAAQDVYHLPADDLYLVGTSEVALAAFHSDEILDAATLPEAVQLASQRAHAGDAVLLSPACASLDMFDNYAHRARVFVDAVHALAEDAGQSLDGGLA